MDQAGHVRHGGCQVGDPGRERVSGSISTLISGVVAPRWMATRPVRQKRKRPRWTPVLIGTASAPVAEAVPRSSG